MLTSQMKYIKKATKNQGENLANNQHKVLYVIRCKTECNPKYISVCNQSETAYTYLMTYNFVDYIRLAAITCQSLGLDKKSTCLCRCFFGAARRTRTADLILTKDALYHLSHSSKL